MPPLLLVTHNWRENIRWHYSWQTEILVANQGNEQRRRLRNKPSKAFSFVLTLMNELDQSMFVGVLSNAPDLKVEFPLWGDELDLVMPAAIGDTALSLSSLVYGREYVVGRRLLIFWDVDQYEIVTVAAGPEVTVSALTQGWPAGTTVVPLEIGRIEANVGGQDLGNVWREPTVTISVDEDISGITGGGDPVPMVAASVVVNLALPGERDYLPWNGTVYLAVSAFTADGELIPNPVISVAWTGGASVTAYPSGRSGYVIAKHDGTVGTSGNVEVTVDGVVGSVGFSV